MSHCESIQESIGRWLDGELPPVDSEAVRSHVASCSECRAAQRQMEKLQLALGSILEAEASRIEFAPFWREVARRIDERQPWYTELSDRLQSLFTAPRVAWAVPAAIVVVLAVFSLIKWPVTGQINNYASVESIDAYGRNVALLREDKTMTTIIWVYQSPEGENETADEPAQPGPAF